MNIVSLIKSFICIVEEGSITAASVKLNVSKSLISRNLKDLEDYLKIRLLNRSTTYLSLTNAGHQYYKEAYVLINQLETLNNKLKNESYDMSGDINILAPNSLTEIILIPFICRFSTKYPLIKINLILSDKLDNLAEKGGDLAIRSGNLARQDLDLIATKIAENRNILCSTPDYLIHHPKINKPSDILAHRIIEDVNLKNNKEWSFVKNGKEEKIIINPTITVNSCQAVKNALANNYGIAVVPELFVKKEVSGGEFTVLLQDYNLHKREIFAIYLKRTNTPQKVKVFIEELKSYFK